jgi:hypothetical protein
MPVRSHRPVGSPGWARATPRLRRLGRHPSGVRQPGSAGARLDRRPSAEHHTHVTGSVGAADHGPGRVHEVAGSCADRGSDGSVRGGHDGLRSPPAEKPALPVARRDPTRRVPTVSREGAGLPVSPDQGRSRRPRDSRPLRTQRPRKRIHLPRTLRQNGDVGSCDNPSPQQLWNRQRTHARTTKRPCTPHPHGSRTVSRTPSDDEHI